MASEVAWPIERVRAHGFSDLGLGELDSGKQKRRADPMRAFPGHAFSVVLFVLSASGVCAPAVAPRSALLGHASAATDVLRLPVRANGLETVTLDFTPMKVFSDDAQLIIVDRSGRERRAELPGTRYYRVAAADDPGLSGVLAVAEAGNIFGLTRNG
ncbi:MAG: hypothetical protein KDI72_11080, partial [Xanthomonadales bacterium]|nr:hypothetical protein [Xanthomonadales bacterium]